MSSITAHFSSMSPNNSFLDIYSADGSPMNVSHIGNVSTKSLTLPNAFLVPKLSYNLLSGGQLCDLGLEVTFSAHGCRVQDPRTRQLLGTGRKVGHLFERNYLHIPDNKMDTPSFPNDRLIQILLCAVELESLQIPYQQIFQTCAATNISPFHLWHSQLGHTSVGKLRPLISRGYTATTILSLYSEQNGRAEHKHKHILDSVRALLISSTCPKRFWGEATLTAVYLINHIPSSVLNNQSPYERLHGTSDELCNASSHAPTSSVEDDLLAGNALDNFEPSSTSSSVSHVDSTNELVVPSSSHPTRIKTQSDGFVECYKARLVAKGFTQEYGIDYEETFALVSHLTSVRSLLVIAAMWRWKLFQMDVKNAFLNGDLEEEVYVKPLLGLNHPPNKVCRLRHALYGLKQSPRAWYAKFSTTVSEFGFTSSPHDTALFIRVEELKQSLSQKFEMKDLGVLSYFLRLEVTSSDDGYLFSQVKYASNLVFKA
ncbi:hypothetical protein SLEP1_g29596 [Rubroshorea leprosula]|uniref:Reverse transcriptase Ty1/copia-type domain-containing protein n=1 Tax=Rubroshorea leprosula TaxID=152421 RepID=A0AAV5K7C6_9ROSI|nr:hypothetical protein SLEP1_g29596 [Rubroshorea leprosula]